MATCKTNEDAIRQRARAVGYENARRDGRCGGFSVSWSEADRLAANAEYKRLKALDGQS